MSTTIRTLRFALYDLSRLRKEFATLFFSVVLPVFFYLLFGASQNYSDMPLGDGNVAAFVMVGMALYAGITGATAASGSSVVENHTGWGRQLALTPLSTGQILFTNFVNIAVRAVLPITAVFITGVFTTASMPAGEWILSYIFTTIAAIPFGFYGMAWALAFPSTNAVSVASTSLVLVAFAANLFVPLSESLLAIGRFTPGYGAASFARWPLAEGAQTIQGDDFIIHDPLWLVLVNIGAWTAIFIAICVVLSNRDKERQ
ncbi:ABC transporter permease [Corynebacterium urogenitale]